MTRRRLSRILCTAAALAVCLAATRQPPTTVAATHTDLVGPAGSEFFGNVNSFLPMGNILPNGNILVVDPGYDAPGPVADVGAVYLYNGATGALISTLTGSTGLDYVGNGNVLILTTGNFVVVSPYWDNGAATDAGAVTWCSGTTGCSGAVSAATSLVGSTAGDNVGIGDVVVFADGDYVVASPGWGNVGAVTWCSGTTGCSGVVSAANSLVGATGGDFVGLPTILPSGDYIVASMWWDNGAATDAGALTWCSGTTGCSGAVSATNSLVGASTGDNVGAASITILSNGNFVVRSQSWDNGAATNAGAVTWCSGTSGCSGVVGSGNSLVGATAGDSVGSTGITLLPNGNYVVRSQFWDNGAATDAGAATWCSGTAGCSGTVTAANSLVGSTAADSVGLTGITVLGNGNYVVRSANWDAPGPVSNVGAVTWCSGTSACSGSVGAGNSLIGSRVNDTVGSSGLTPLSNSDYIVRSQNWDLTATVTNVGAITRCGGSGGCVGAVSAANSLVGSRSSDTVGSSGIVVLPSGNYVVRSNSWDLTATITNVGAVTWCSGTASCVGAVSAANSLIGSTLGDSVGSNSVVVIPTNGNYVVNSGGWDAPGPIANAGASTWCSGTSGCTGSVSAANSLVGSIAGNQVGSGDATPLANGNYVVRSPGWDVSATTIDVGAVTWCSGASGCNGTVSAANSLVGSTTNDVVGNVGLQNLPSGHYLVRSANWDNGAATNAGAVTTCSGTGGCSGAVSATNSLVGSTTDDATSGLIVIVLANDTFVVSNPRWDGPGGAVDAGAVTWCSATSGCSGAIGAGNSLVGSIAGDVVGTGTGSITVLPSGNYVVRSLNWQLTSVLRVGAVTWCSGTGGCIGAISASNSLIGSAHNDGLGVGGVKVLPSGNYVVASPSWDNGAAADAGAATWASGTTGLVGVVSAANSLVGTTAFDAVGTTVSALANGHYLVHSNLWDNGAATDAGALTWGSGTTGVLGEVSAANSLVGSTANDQVGYDQYVKLLSTGDYVALTPSWNGGLSAATWGSGTTGVTGEVSAVNSLVGTTAGDYLGAGEVRELPNGNFMLQSPYWDNGASVDAGAVTLGLDTDAACAKVPVVGELSAANSVMGVAANGGWTLYPTYDPVNHQLVVPRPLDNIVSLYAADDRDGDCVDDMVEDGAPNGGDGNADGKQDKIQGHVASLPNDANGDYLTLVAPSGMQLAEVDALPNPSPGDAPAGVTFPVGFAEFKLSPMPAPPASVVMSMLLENPAPSSQYWRYGPEPGDPTDHWYRFDPVGGSPATGATLVSPTQVDLTFVDGARGDDDGAANGTLVDEGGPGNLPPTAGAGGPYSGAEGAAIALSGGSASDPESGTLTYHWTVDSGLCSFDDVDALAPTLTCTDNGSFTVTLGVSDGYHPAVTSDADVTVANVAPNLGAISVDQPLVAVNTTVNASASFTDPGAADTHTATAGWNWGDASTSDGTISESGGNGTTGGSHSYSAPGVYTVKAKVTDDDGALSNEPVYSYVVVYDPDGGFVTGGGWITSPSNACPVFCGGATGRANFGFVAKYKKGKSVPEGDTEFEFNAGNLYFESLSYDWLVVAGPHAKFKGVGTINGSGSYQFMLTARDGQISGGGGTDGFRIKIWNDDGVIYDNQWGASDDSNDSTNIGGGSIVIHKP